MRTEPGWVDRFAGERTAVAAPWMRGNWRQRPARHRMRQGSTAERLRRRQAGARRRRPAR